MTNLTVAQINSAIIGGSLTNEDLNSIGDAVRFARLQIANLNKFTMRIGSQVKFTQTRSGQVVFATVEKVNRKYIIVRENGKAHGVWRVPANMLTSA